MNGFQEIFFGTTALLMTGAATLLARALRNEKNGKKSGGKNRATTPQLPECKEKFEWIEKSLLAGEQKFERVFTDTDEIKKGVARTAQTIAVLEERTRWLSEFKK